ncbi:transporter substrate-binding domain-containing protein [bacterium LRH843]|nr:transporter substrate-binding domain-containing protein [bacterium LRH843]
MMSVLILGACGSDKTTSGDPVGDSAKETPTKKVLRVGTSGIYPPFASKGKDGNLEGYDVDVLEAVGEKLGYEIEWTVAEFSGLFGMMDSGRIDTIANSISINAERQEKYDFTEPNSYSGVILVVKDDRDDIETLEDLKGKSLGALLGNNMHQYITQWNEQNGNEINIRPYQDVSATYDEVAIGRLDAFIDSRITAFARIKKEGLPLKLSSDKTIFDVDNAFPFVRSEENKAFIEEFNKALQELRDEGKLKEFSDKWSEVDLSSR